MAFFKNLNDVVAFYATRNADPRRWYASCWVANDLPSAYLKNIVSDRAPFNHRPANAYPVFTAAEGDDIVAFRTLTDGYTTLPTTAVPATPAAPTTQTTGNPFRQTIPITILHKIFKKAATSNNLFKVAAILRFF